MKRLRNVLRDTHMGAIVTALILCNAIEALASLIMSPVWHFFFQQQAALVGLTRDQSSFYAVRSLIAMVVYTALAAGLLKWLYFGKDADDNTPAAIANP